MDRAQAAALLESASMSTPTFTFDGLESWARVVDVIDGDTIHVVLPNLSNHTTTTLHKISLRLEGMDTCEIKSKDIDSKEKALRARLRLLELCTRSQPNHDIQLGSNKMGQLIFNL